MPSGDRFRQTFLVSRQLAKAGRPLQVLRPSRFEPLANSPVDETARLCSDDIHPGGVCSATPLVVKMLGRIRREIGSSVQESLQLSFAGG
jgi:hypothetical protein